MQQVFFCQVRDLLLKVFNQRKHLIRNDKDKKDITLTEVEILENEFSLIFTDSSAAKFLVKNFVMLLLFIKSGNQEQIAQLKFLLFKAKQYDEK